MRFIYFTAYALTDAEKEFVSQLEELGATVDFKNPQFVQLSEVRGCDGVLGYASDEMIAEVGLVSIEDGEIKKRFSRGPGVHIEPEDVVAKQSFGHDSAAASQEVGEQKSLIDESSED